MLNLAILRNRELCLLWSAFAVSTFGDFFTYVAFLVLLQTRISSASAIAGLIISQTIAVLLLSPFVGTWVDKYSRKHIMILSDILRAILVASIPFLQHLYQFYIVGFLLSAATVPFDSLSRLNSTLLDRRYYFLDLRSLAINADDPLFIKECRATKYILEVVQRGIFVYSSCYISSNFIVHSDHSSVRIRDHPGSSCDLHQGDYGVERSVLWAGLIDYSSRFLCKLSVAELSWAAL